MSPSFKRGKVRIIALLSVLATALALFAITGTARADAPSTLTVWVSPQGSDANNGLTASSPFATLQHAGDWLCGSTSTCAGRGQPVIIRLAQTTIRVTRTINWRYYDPSYPTTFEPWTYQPGEGWTQLSATGGEPTFDGAFAVDHGLAFRPAHAGSGSTRLNFVYLRWQRFNISAMEIFGGTTTVKTSTGITVDWPLPDAANGITWYGDYFYQIGNLWNPSHPMGWGAVDAYNSSGDSFVNNHFVELENSFPADAGHVHALYLSHHSDGTIVEHNEFRLITGDVVRQRDLSERTLVKSNVFTEAGDFGYVDDWYCRPGEPDSLCFPKEYRSWSGVFTGNKLNGLFPLHAAGAHLAYCYDVAGGVCPSNRWNT